MSTALLFYFGAGKGEEGLLFSGAGKGDVHAPPRGLLCLLLATMRAMRVFVFVIVVYSVCFSFFVFVVFIVFFVVITLQCAFYAFAVGNDGAFVFFIPFVFCVPVAHGILKSKRGRNYP